MEEAGRRRLVGFITEALRVMENGTGRRLAGDPRWSTKKKENESTTETYDESEIIMIVLNKDLTS